MWAAGSPIPTSARAGAAKVVFERDPDAETTELTSGKMTCAVEIELADGETLSARCDHVKGSPGNPMTRDELVAKFEANTYRVGTGIRTRLIDTIEHLEDQNDTASLMETLGAPIEQ